MILNDKQQGVTFLGFLMVCSLIVFFAFLGMRLWPVYNEKLKVDQAMNSVVERDDIGTLNKKTIGKYMLRHFEVEDVDQFERMKDLENILSLNKVKGKKVRLLRMNYEIRRPIINAFDVIYTYDNSIEIKGSGG